MFLMLSLERNNYFLWLSTTGVTRKERKIRNDVYTHYTDLPTGIANLSSIRTHEIRGMCPFWLSCATMFEPMIGRDNGA